MTAAGIGTVFDSAAAQYAEVSPLLWDRIGAATVTAAAIGDATTWEGPAYDVVQCVHGVFFLPDMDASVSRLADLLRPGGRLVITTWAQGAMERFGRLLGEAVGHVRRAQVEPPTSRQAASRIGTEEDLHA
ncbi:class I SAM-dependent methyltransferase [Nonomuraea rubra]|uniref:class I SAM-dependent methyltransferase n=1 Tax=Nonomuraea rubra TaxID=46180 RepID=UPI0033C81C0D